MALRSEVMRTEEVMMAFVAVGECEERGLLGGQKTATGEQMAD